MEYMKFFGVIETIPLIINGDLSNIERENTFQKRRVKNNGEGNGIGKDPGQI